MKKIYLSFGLIFALAVTSLAITENQQAYAPAPPTQTATVVNAPAATTTDPRPNTTPVHKSHTNSAPTTPSIARLAHTSGTVEKRTSYTFTAASASTVLEAMQWYAHTSSFDYKTKEFPGLGVFVESINGLENAGGYFWILYINGKDSNKGASTAHVNAGDDISWRYEKGY